MVTMPSESRVINIFTAAGASLLRDMIERRGSTSVGSTALGTATDSISSLELPVHNQG